MHKIIADRIEGLLRLDSPAEASNAALGLYRILMLNAVNALYEWCVQKIRSSGFRPEGLELPLQEARKPTDGGMVTALSELFVAAENLGWKNVSNPWWESDGSTRPAWRLVGAGSRSPESLATAYVRKRNDGLGHGIPGAYEPSIDADFLRVLLRAIKHVLPTHLSTTNKLVLEGAGLGIEVRQLKVVDGSPLLYREMRPIGGGRARVTGQVLLTDFSRQDATFEVEDILGLEPSTDASGLNFFSTFESGWNPLGRVPDRTTLEFTGRIAEFGRLAEWFDDSGSRACLVFGDGGVGKTTLLIEFLHRVFSGRLTTEWRPEAVFFYTAKQTQWTVDGLRFIGVPRTGLSDALRSIPASILGVLGREWYQSDVPSLAAKVESFLLELGIRRGNVLLVVDNAETLAKSEAEVDQLADELNAAVRRVGRVILTSRRRERIEARQVQLEALPEDDALQLMRARGAALGKRQVREAGDSTLRGFARKLACKPISLEVFINAIEPGGSLEHAFQRVTRLQQSDLGEFLFEDAWQRMGQRVRVLLLLMTRISDVHDEVLLKLACQECSVGVREAEEALQETLGIATLTKAAGHLSIAFSDEFRRYCKDRTEQIGAINEPTPDAEQRVAQRYSTYLKAQSAALPSKDARAFRHATARAAYAAAADGRVADAILFYEEAVLADADNPYLWDRFAYYLMMQKRAPEALEKAQRAVRLAPRDPNILFTKGMIEAKAGDVVNATRTLSLAASQGMVEHRCWLGRAYAHMNSAARDFEQVEHCIQSARQTCPPRIGHQEKKHLEEVTRLEARLARERKRGP